MGLSRDSKERALRTIVEGTYLGLATAKQGSVLVEVTDPAYRRQAVTYGDVTHDGERSTIANAVDVTFQPFAANAAAELRYWFLIRAPHGEGIVAASGMIEPQGMIDPATGSIYTMDEVKGRKDASGFKLFYARPLAGVEPRFVPGQIMVYIGDSEEP